MVWEGNNQYRKYFYDSLAFQFMNVWNLRACDYDKNMKTAYTKISVVLPPVRNEISNDLGLLV